MRVIRLQGENIEDDKASVLEHIKDLEVIFVYTGNNALYKYIECLELSNKNLFRLNICKEVEPITVAYMCGDQCAEFTRLSELLETIDTSIVSEVIVKGDLSKDDKIIKNVRTQVSEIVQQFVYLNMPLDKIQVMTESEHKNNEKVRSFSNKVHEYEENIAYSLDKLSKSTFEHCMEIKNTVNDSLLAIKGYLKDAKDNELKIATAASKKSGKSMIVNSMLKCELAPTSLELATPNNCIYRKSNEGYVLEYNGEKKQFSTDKEMRNCIYDIFKRAEQDKASGYAVPDMNIGYIPIEEGLSTYTIYDTPGPDLAGAEGHKKAAYEAINNVDVIIFSIDYAKYLTDSEFDYLKRIKEKFTEDKKFYSLIINVNKLDCRYSSGDDKSIVRILDFIRNRLIDIAPEFRDAIVIGTSALTYFDCIQMEKIPECASLGKENSFRDDLEELIEQYSDDSINDENVNAMQFVNTMVSNIKTFDGIKIENIDQIKRHSGMPNLLRYVEYIAQEKARVEKVNNLIYRIDTEYAKIQNLFRFQQLEEALAENQEKLDQATKILTTFSDRVEVIFDESYPDVNQKRNDKEFISTTLNMVGDRTPFELEYIYVYCSREYIEKDLDPDNIIKYIAGEVIKSKFQNKINELFNRSTIKRTINGVRRTVVEEDQLMEAIVDVLRTTDCETKAYVEKRIGEIAKVLELENTNIMRDLKDIIDARIEALKNAVEKCESDLDCESGIKFYFEMPEYDFFFREDWEKIENKSFSKIMNKEYIMDIKTIMNNRAKEKWVSNSSFDALCDWVMGIMKKRKYNQMCYDKSFLTKLYENNLQSVVSGAIAAAEIQSLYAPEKMKLKEELRDFVDYIKKELREQIENANTYYEQVKSIIDHTSDYKNNIDAIQNKQCALEVVHDCVEPFCCLWKTSMRESDKEVS